MNASPCRLCGARAAWVGTQPLLAKYDVAYFLCDACELLETEPPHWLDEAYASAISRLDTGAVQRNQECARLTQLIAGLLDLPADARCLDYGAGHGVFVRMMRDAGLDFAWTDKFADNLYAGGFEGDARDHHALVTAFEVLEHFADVRADLEQLFAGAPDHVLVGTVLHAGYQPGWWYYLPDSGQHVAFYSPRTLAWIAQHFAYDVVVGPEYSLFSRARLGAVRRALVQQVLRRPRTAIELAALVPAPLRRRLGPYRSLVQADHDRMRAKR